MQCWLLVFRCTTSSSTLLVLTCRASDKTSLSLLLAHALPCFTSVFLFFGGFGELRSFLAILLFSTCEASRIMKLLLMPLTFAVTAALQMFLPGAAELLALLRTCQLALSMNVIIELLFILNGSQKQIVTHLPGRADCSLWKATVVLHFRMGLLCSEGSAVASSLFRVWLAAIHGNPTRGWA